MDTSLESLNQEPNHKKAKSERESRKALRRMGNPLWGFAWRFLLCCALIDLPFWAYFHFVKEVPILVGLEQIQKELQMKINKPKEPEPFNIAQADVTQPIKKPSWGLKRISPVENGMSGDIEVKESAEIMRKIVDTNNRSTKFQGVIYSWRNTKGYKIYSNTGFPKNEPYSEGKIEYQ